MNEQSYDDLLALCQKRRSTRSFSEKPLSAGQIEKIKAVAMTSPYASGRKNWEVITVTEKETIAKMAEVVDTRVKILAEALRNDVADDFIRYAKNFSIFREAPAIFIPAFRNAPLFSLMLKGGSGGKEPSINETTEANETSIWERDNYVKSISCVSMLVLLATESLGLASCYMTGPLIAEKELGALIPLKPGYSIGALIPVGHTRAAPDAGE